MATGSATLGAMFGAGEVAGFMGLPQVSLADIGGARVVVLGAPGCTPYASVGHYCAGGPAAIRAGGAAYAANLAHMNFDLGGTVLPEGIRAVDAGDLEMTAADGAANRDRLRGAVGQVLAMGAVPVLIGGDDSLPIPMLQALEGHGPLTILQIDAHIDWRDEVGGERWGLSSTMRRASEMGHVARPGRGIIRRPWRRGSALCPRVRWPQRALTARCRRLRRARGWLSVSMSTRWTRPSCPR